MRRYVRTLAVATALLLLGACDRAPAPEPAAAPSVAATAVATAKPAAVASVPDFSGVGPLRWNMSAAQMRAAWGRPLYGEASGAGAQPGACIDLRPKAKAYDLLFMVERDRFVRVDVRDAGVVAPGGGRIGQSVAQVRQLYGARMQAQPHKYVEGAQYLVVTPADGGPARLVFETDAGGTVRAWRIGLPPQVFYVEGCA